MHSLSVQDDDKWKCFGIFLAFCISNWVLVYVLIYTVRVRGWTFGFGPLSRGLGKVVDAVKGVGKK